MSVSKEDLKPIVTLRRVLKIGPSFYFNMPADYIKRHGIKKGDKLAIVGDNVLKVVCIE